VRNFLSTYLWSANISQSTRRADLRGSPRAATTARTTRCAPSVWEATRSKIWGGVQKLFKCDSFLNKFVGLRPPGSQTQGLVNDRELICNCLLYSKVGCNILEMGIMQSMELIIELKYSNELKYGTIELSNYEIAKSLNYWITEQLNYENMKLWKYDIMKLFYIWKYDIWKYELVRNVLI